MHKYNWVTGVVGGVIWPYACAERPTIKRYVDTDAEPELSSIYGSSVRQGARDRVWLGLEMDYGPNAKLTLLERSAGRLYFIVVAGYADEVAAHISSLTNDTADRLAQDPLLVGKPLFGYLAYNFIQHSRPGPVGKSLHAEHLDSPPVVLQQPPPTLRKLSMTLPPGEPGYDGRWGDGKPLWVALDYKEYTRPLWLPLSAKLFFGEVDNIAGDMTTHVYAGIEAFKNHGH